MKEAGYFKKLENEQVQCRLCNHFCIIENSGTGICQVRKNINGQLYSLVFGFPNEISADPIEKKPFYHFLPKSLALSIGTFGCNFLCSNCLNYSSSQAKIIEKQLLNYNEISPERIIGQAIDEGCKSIAYTYNEPTVFTEYALEIMKLAHRNDLKNVWVSNGYMSDDCLNSIIPYLDAINIDLKSFDDDFYETNCQGKLEPILNNLVKIKREQVHLEITTLIIPSLSSDIEMLTKLTNFIANDLDVDTPWHITRFSPEISWKLKALSSTGEDMIYSAYEIGKQAGLKFVYVGNIPGDQKENTYCPKCSELAIRRLGFHIERFDSKGRCEYCDHSLEIIE